ncbi:hypothetical protein BD309DRAFT_159279 [Dichomitus squalens]|nr:hypothetical protein BD309DRAFT_159279 [Dichomitus squalens]
MSCGELRLHLDLLRTSSSRGRPVNVRISHRGHGIRRRIHVERRMRLGEDHLFATMAVVVGLLGRRPCFRRPRIQIELRVREVLQQSNAEVSLCANCQQGVRASININARHRREVHAGQCRFWGWR